MAKTALCCSSVEDPRALMKTGLSLVLVGHVNFLLGALVHGAVLRHINLHQQARAREYAISNVVALAGGLAGVVVGILAIVLSKNTKSRGLAWSLFMTSLLSALLAAASALGLTVAVARAAIHGGRSLLTHCRFPDAIGYSSITNECPFDPTRIYSTTLILWVPLIATCAVQLAFSSQCLAACATFLALPRPCGWSRRGGRGPPSPTTTINTAPPLEVATLPHTIPRQQHHRHHPPLHHHQSERQPLRGAAALGAGPTLGAEQHELLVRGNPQRTSFWI